MSGKIKRVKDLKDMDLLTLVQYYNKDMTQRKIANMAKRLKYFIEEGFTIKELISFLNKNLKTDLWPSILRQWEHSFSGEDPCGEPIDFSIDNYILSEGEHAAYFECEVSIILNKFKSYLDYKNDVNIFICEYCNKMFSGNSIEEFLYTEQDMYCCKDCASTSEAVLKDSGFENFHFVTGLTDDIPEDFVKGREESIEDIKELLEVLKQIIDYGHSIEFARVLTMGGYHADETDYLMKYKDTVEDAQKNQKISNCDYEFFHKLLKTSNSIFDMPYEEDDSVYQLIRITNY